MKRLPVKAIRGKQIVDDPPNFSGRVGLAVPPGFRLVSARMLNPPQYDPVYEVEVAPQHWNPRYWWYRWQLRRATVMTIEVTE